MPTRERLLNKLKRLGQITLLDLITIFVMHIFAKQRQPATDFGPALTIVFVFGLPFWYAVLRFFDAIHRPLTPAADSQAAKSDNSTPVARSLPKLDKFMRIIIWLVISIVMAMMIMLHLEAAGSGH